MEGFKFDTVEDLQNIVNSFYKIPIKSRFVFANKIHRRLKELNGYVNVFKENPILNYPSERFIVDNDLSHNEYSKFTNLLNTDVEAFNFSVYNDISLSLDNIKGFYDIVRVCREQNNKADDLYLKKYPTHKDIIAVFKMAVSKITLFLLHGSSIDIVKTAMDDIEFLISTNVLSDSHIRRLMLAPITIKDNSIFKSVFPKDLSERLTSLFNTQIELVKQRKDEFMMLRPFNDEALKAYLKIQKMGYEETLVNSYYNGDYSLTDRIFNVDINLVTLVREIVKSDYPNLEMINMIDKFILEQNGLKPIMNKVYNGQDYYVHHKNGIQYVLFKNPKIKDIYFMITRFKDGKIKSYKITVNNTNTLMDKITMDTVLESTFIVDGKKMNR